MTTRIFWICPGYRNACRDHVPSDCGVGTIVHPPEASSRPAHEHPDHRLPGSHSRDAWHVGIGTAAWICARQERQYALMPRRSCEPVPRSAGGSRANVSQPPGPLRGRFPGPGEVALPAGCQPPTGTPDSALTNLSPWRRLIASCLRGARGGPPLAVARLGSLAVPDWTLWPELTPTTTTCVATSSITTGTTQSAMSAGTWSWPPSTAGGSTTPVSRPPRRSLSGAKPPVSRSIPASMSPERCTSRAIAAERRTGGWWCERSDTV